MTAQRVHQRAKHRGPFKELFQPIAHRRDCKAAVIDTTRKMVMIASLKLKNNELYRDAKPDLIDGKYPS